MNSFYPFWHLKFGIPLLMLPLAAQTIATGTGFRGIWLELLVSSLFLSLAAVEVQQDVVQFKRGLTWQTLQLSEIRRVHRIFASLAILTRSNGGPVFFYLDDRSRPLVPPTDEGLLAPVLTALTGFVAGLALQTFAAVLIPAADLPYSSSLRYLFPLAIWIATIHQLYSKQLDRRRKILAWLLTGFASGCLVPFI